MLKKYAVYMIADEVICGFGRTGNYWGSETFGIKPDSISVAKAITSAYIPLGGITIPEAVYEAMLDESRKIGTFGHGYTYTAHPVGAAVALKTIEIYKRDGIVGRAAQLGEVFQSRLAALGDHPLVGNTRGRGMIGALELVADKATRRPFDPKLMVGLKAAEIAQSNGLLIRAMGDALGCCPPLIIQEDEVNEIFDRIEKTLDQTEALVTREGLRTA